MLVSSADGTGNALPASTAQTSVCHLSGCLCCGILPHLVLPCPSLPLPLPASVPPCPPARTPSPLPPPFQLLSFHERKYMTALWQTECTAYMRRYERANKPVTAFLADIQKYLDLKEEVSVRCGGCGVNRWM